MKDNQFSQRKPRIAGVLTLTGILIGLLLSVLAAWADYEATSYGFLRRAKTPFQGLICPVFIGKSERKTVSVTVSNPTDLSLSPGVWTEISTSQETDSKIEHIQLAPGEQVTVQRTVGPEHIDLGFFIFVDALVYSAYPMPDRENTCGILVLPINGGTQLLILGTVLSALCLAAGLFISYRNERGVRQPPSMLFMVIATVLAMIFSFMGWWMPAVLLIVLLTLTLVITAGTFFR